MELVKKNSLKQRIIIANSGEMHFPTRYGFPLSFVLFVKLNFQQRSVLKIVFERIPIVQRIGINEFNTPMLASF